MKNSLFASIHPCYYAVAGNYICDCGSKSDSITGHRRHLQKSPACVEFSSTQADTDWLQGEVKMPLYVHLKWTSGMASMSEIMSTRNYRYASGGVALEKRPKFVNRAGGGFCTEEFEIIRFVPETHACVFWECQETVAEQCGILSPEGEYYPCEFGGHGDLIRALLDKGVKLKNWLRIGGGVSYFLD